MKGVDVAKLLSNTEAIEFTLPLSVKAAHRFKFGVSDTPTMCSCVLGISLIFLCVI